MPPYINRTLANPPRSGPWNRTMTQRFLVTYHVRSDAAGIAARARTIAIEQSVEMPVEAIDEPDIVRDVVGEVADIADLGNGRFAVRIALAAATVGTDPGQFLNMLFGNTSLHDDVVLHDAEIPPALLAAHRGPNVGLAGLRARLGAGRRALTCSAIKPQGLPPDRLATLVERFALGRLDFVKDDHGLADQACSPFAARVAACAAAARRAAAATGHPTRYVPSVTGTLDAMRAQTRAARDAGLDTVMVAPMIAGLANVAALTRDFPGMAFFAHPTLGGAARIAPALLIGTLFRLVGADAVIFPNHGGRFGYSPATCRAIAAAALGPHPALRPAVPVPAGGMTRARVPEMLDFYGPDVMLLIGGSLLAAGDRLTEETARFVAGVTA
jgi:ribulose-bisphosphate carboxylase large chain